MWKSIVNFFKTINAGLTAVEDYFDYRFKTGKWTGDVTILAQKTNKNLFIIHHKIGRSKYTRSLIMSIRHIWNRLLSIPLIERSANIIIDAYCIIRKSLIETIIILQVAFLSVVILFNLFVNAPLLFFVSFFPILFFNSLLSSALYFMARDGKKDVKMPLQESLRVSIQSFSKVSSLIVIHVIVSIILIASFFIIATFYSYFFTSIRVSWENAFGYWVVVAPLFFLLLAVLFGLNIIATQAYFILLFEGKNIFYSFRKGLELLKEHLTWFSFFYLFFILVFAHISYWISLLFFPLGFIASLFFFIQIFIFLGFLVRREFPHTHINPSENISGEDKMLLMFCMIFGITTYFATAVLTIKEHNAIINIIDQTQNQFLVSQQLKSYTNPKYGYTLDYPQRWSIHEEKDNSITIYNNTTQTTVGGIYINIKALPFSKVDFDKLYEARSGLSAYNTLDKNITIKINNLLIDYKYPAVKYTYLKSGTPFNEYSINYLIHKDDLMYVVSFITYDKDIQGENLDLFEMVINSFKFEY